MIVDVHAHFMDMSYGPELVKRGYIELSSDKLVIKVKGISSVIYSEVSNIKAQIMLWRIQDLI